MQIYAIVLDGSGGILGIFGGMSSGGLKRK